MALLLLALFIGLPILELYVIIQVGIAIGILPTIALLIVDSMLGAALARSQGRAAWRRFNAAMADGRMPTDEVFDGAMVILGGALLLTPGFVSDVFALILLIPPTRAGVRELLKRSVARRGGITWRVSGTGPRAGGPGSGASRGFERGPRRGYDHEGSAREIDETPNELPGGQGNGDAG